MIPVVPSVSVYDQPPVDASYYNGITSIPPSLMVKICQLTINK